MIGKIGSLLCLATARVRSYSLRYFFTKETAFLLSTGAGIAGITGSSEMVVVSFNWSSCAIFRTVINNKQSANATVRYSFLFNIVIIFKDETMPTQGLD